LKNIEGTASVLIHLLKDGLLNNGLVVKVGALLTKKALKNLMAKFDVDRYGGAVLLGVDAPVVKTHGRSDARAIYYTIKQVDKIMQEKIIDEFRAEFGHAE
ncbi:phosphate acyltransferase, partial [Lactobacillus sp. XV13L]|nr:phosphate acyltransferase [Lactobacillus sp. XV13L]